MVKTLGAAVGIRRFVLASTIAAVVGTLRFFEARGMTWLSEVPSWTVAIVTLLGLLLFWVLQYANEQRLEAEPQLAIEFGMGEPFVYDHRHEPDKTDLIASMVGPEVYRCYRFRVTNVGGKILHACKVQITRVTTDAGKEYVGIPFSLRHDRSGEEVFTLRQGETTMVSLLAVPISGHSAGFSAVKAGAFGESWPPFGATATGIVKEPSTIVVSALSEGPLASKSLRFEIGDDGHYQVKEPRIDPYPPPAWWVALVRYWTSLRDNASVARQIPSPEEARRTGQP